MNQREWKTSGKFSGKYVWYNKTRKIQKSLQYNSDEKADRIHHLRDTEEQRNYNDTYYELWGHNLDGSFEYGKYVIFVTEEWHNSYHSQSDETIAKRANSNRGKKRSNETKARMSRSISKSLANDDIRKRMSDSAKASWTEERCEKARANNTGEKNPMYGKSLNKEACDSKSSSMKALWSDNEYKQQVSKSMRESWTDEKRIEYSKKFSGDKNPMYGKRHSEDILQRIKNTKILRRSLYNDYKSSGGQLSYSDFRDYILPNLRIEE